MDFRAPPAVVQAAREEADFGNYGYAKAHPGLVDSVVRHCQSLYGWEIDPNWLVWLPGMVCALNVCCRMQQEVAGQALTHIPVYPPFLSAPGNFGLSCTRLPLQLTGNRFSMDFELMEKTPTQPGDLFMLCHPHNPVGTAFSRPELERFAAWAKERELVICSDEIHCDLLLEPGLKHLPLAMLNEDLAGRTLTLMAPSKTYNLPGFGCSFAIISNTDLRLRFKKAMAGIVPDPAVMASVSPRSPLVTGKNGANPCLPTCGPTATTPSPGSEECTDLLPTPHRPPICSGWMPATFRSRTPTASLRNTGSAYPTGMISERPDFSVSTSGAPEVYSSRHSTGWSGPVPRRLKDESAQFRKGKIS